MSCLIIAVRTLQNVLVYGENKNNVLTHNTMLNKPIYRFIAASTEFDDVRTIVGGDNLSYILTNGGVYITGVACKLEGDDIRSYYTGKSEYLKNYKVADVSASTMHAIVLTVDQEIHTIGNNAMNQLGRTSGSSYSKGQVTYPVKEPIIQVGAMRNLSYVVHSDAIYVVGQCEYGLCGNLNGAAIDQQLSTWTKMDLSNIQDLQIQHVYFGTEQLIIQTKDSGYYYLGKNANKQACNTSDPIVSAPSRTPFQGMRLMKANENVTAGLSEDGRLLYCGCNSNIRCDWGSITWPSSVQVPGQGNTLDFGINNGWLVLRDTGVVNQSQTSSSWSVVELPYNPGNALYPTKLTETAKWVMLYKQVRGLAITVDQECTVRVGQQQLTIQDGVEQIVNLDQTQHPTWSSVNVLISKLNCMPVNDSVTVKDGVVHLNYKLVNGGYINVIFDIKDSSGTKVNNVFFNILQVSDRSRVSSGFASSGHVLQLQSTQINMNQVYIITAVDSQGSYFPLEKEIAFTIQNTTLSLVLQRTKEYQISFQGPNGQPVAGLDITYTISQQETQRTTDSNGVIKIGLTYQQVNSTTGFQIRVYFAGSDLYQPYDNTITWFPNYQNNLTFYLREQTTYRLDIVVRNNAQGKFSVLLQTTSQLCAEIPVTNAQTYQLRISSRNCNVQIGDIILIEYSDPNDQYYAASKTVTVASYMSVVYTLYENNYRITFTVTDQRNSPADGYEFRVTHDNITYKNLTTDNRGQADTTMILSDIYAGSRKIYITGAEQTEYRALSVVEILADQLYNDISISVYKYGMMSVAITASDAVQRGGVSGLTVRFLKDSDGSEIFSGTTNDRGRVEYQVEENIYKIELNTRYRIVISDPLRRYKDYQTTHFVTQLSSTVTCLMNARQLYFRVVDTINNANATGAQVTLYIGQDTQVKSSDANGFLEFDVPDNLQGMQLGFSVAGSDIYKPIARQSFTYSVDQITLRVQSYLNFSLTVTIRDGNTDQPVDGLSAVISTMTGDVKKTGITTNALGQFLLEFSEKDNIIGLNTVYKMEINDPHHRYSDTTYNYSVTRTDENTTVQLNLQLLHVTLANIDAERVPNVTVVLHADGAEIARDVTNALGFACFYLKESDYVDKQLKYKALQSDMYRETSLTPVVIRSQPQYVVRVLFPLVIFKLDVKLTLNETEETEREESALVTEQKKYDFRVSLVDKNGTVIHNMSVNRLGEVFDERFVENINQSLALNSEYRLYIHDMNGEYEDIERNFTLTMLQHNFTLQLTPQSPYSFNIPFYGVILTVVGIMGLWYLIYAYVELRRAIVRVKREEPQPSDGQNIKQRYLDLVQTNLNMILLRQDQQKARKHVTLSQLDPRNDAEEHYEMELDRCDSASIYDLDTGQDGGDCAPAGQT